MRQVYRGLGPTQTRSPELTSMGQNKIAFTDPNRLNGTVWFRGRIKLTRDKVQNRRRRSTQRFAAQRTAAMAYLSMGEAHRRITEYLNRFSDSVASQDGASLKSLLALSSNSPNLLALADSLNVFQALSLSLSQTHKTCDNCFSS